MSAAHPDQAIIDAFGRFVVGFVVSERWASAHEDEDEIPDAIMRAWTEPSDLISDTRAKTAVGMLCKLEAAAIMERPAVPDAHCCDVFEAAVLSVWQDLRALASG